MAVCLGQPFIMTVRECMREAKSNKKLRTDRPVSTIQRPSHKKRLADSLKSTPRVVRFAECTIRHTSVLLANYLFSYLGHLLGIIVTRRSFPSSFIFEEQNSAKVQYAKASWGEDLFNSDHSRSIAGYNQTSWDSMRVWHCQPLMRSEISDTDLLEQISVRNLQLCIRPT